VRRCARKMPSYSTPSDLLRFALATNADSVNGELAGGSVMSLMTRRDNGIVVGVTSNIAHAYTGASALKVADTFAEQKWIAAPGWCNAEPLPLPAINAVAFSNLRLPSARQNVHGWFPSRNCPNPVRNPRAESAESCQLGL
jgi:hypothetical protein